jgi:CRISPR-associated protein (TIGR02584 family)
MAGPSRSRGSAPRPQGPDTVLITPVGLNPQVITETLYALLVRRRPAVPVREVHVLATTEGRKRLLGDLLRPTDGWFHRFCRDYRISPGTIAFGPSQVHLLRGASGQPLSDIRSAADSAAVADQVLRFVARQAARGDVALHCSVAGGRKTMGLLLGFALMLHGRQQDVLSHVLVDPEFESSPEFFYPPPRRHMVQVRGGRRADASGARVELAEIPFVRLRAALPFIEWPEDARYAGLVQAAEGMLGGLQPERLVCDVPARTIRVGDQEIPLRPQLLAFYTLFARRKVRECVRPERKTCGHCAECFFSAGKDFPTDQRDRLLSLYQAVGGRDERLPSTVAGKEAAGVVQQLRSKVNKAIEEALGGELAASAYVIRSVGPYEKRHGIALDKGLIEVRE